MKKILPIILSLLLFPAVILAQESISITAIPPRLELSALPGATLQEAVKFRNETETEMAVSVVTEDFIVNDNQGTPVAVSEAVSGRWSLAGWITTSPKQLVIAPGQTVSIDLIIAIPDNALPGGHYAMVTYEPIAENTLQEGSGTAIRPKVGSLIYLNVVGDVIEAANLKNFTSEAKFAHYGPMKLSAEIENLGDVHFAPKGTMTISNLLNDPVATYELEEKNIFPFASRLYAFELPGKYHLGRFKAEINATAGESQVPIRGLIYFWIVPVKELAGVGAALLAIIILIILKRRKTYHHPDELTPEEPMVTPPAAIS